MASTLWKLEPHTKGKHAVMRGYLNAWLPIIARYNSRVLFIDGFAGPGKYVGGEEGSPLIAIRVLREHAARAKIKEVFFIFIELMPSVQQAWSPNWLGSKRLVKSPATVTSALSSASSMKACRAFWRN